ncbi:unnamed protein product [Discosporangium mesarthrocarpum]
MTFSSDDLVRPFTGLRPAPGRAADIAAPPYDVVNTDEARALAAGRPYCFFHVSRAEIDLPPETDPYAPKVYETAAKNLRSFEQSGALVRDTAPCFYIYRITAGGQSQTGVAVSASVQAYNENRIKKHELTRPAKEDDRVRQIEAVNSITGPVFTVHRADAELASIFDGVTAGAPDAVADGIGGALHELWVVSDAATVGRIGALMNAMDALYIADGHHRSAAGGRIAASRAAANPDHDGSEAYNGFLAVSFPDDQVTILDYNRVIRDLNGRDAAAFRDALAEQFEITSKEVPVRPEERGTFGMYLDGAWALLTPKTPPAMDDPVVRLDVQVLARMVLEPLLGIADQRTDTRIDFVGGSRGPEEISRRVESGEMAIGFTFFPTSLADLMAVADADMIMPPKSTWFEPKLADGMISLPLD